MKRSRAILIGCASVTLVGVTAAALMALDHRRDRMSFTNGSDVRVPANNAQPRTVVWETPKALAHSINSEQDEYEPRVSADGQTMFLVRGKAGENADILTGKRLGWPSDVWGNLSLVSEINSDADELGPEISRDGNVLYFHSNRPGGLGGYDLWRSQRGDDGWCKPENLGPLVNSPHDEYGAALSPDGARLVFASNRPRDGADVSAKGDAWPATLRENLPRHDFDLFEWNPEARETVAATRVAELSTTANEGSPAFSPGGDFLWFCSDREGGSGGFDLWRARIVRDTYREAENAGQELNTPFNELDPALAMGGFELYFSSDRDGEARYDVYRSMSHDVFEDVEASEPWIDWASVWHAILPPLMWLLLLLLGLLLLLALIRGVRSRKLSLLMRCLLASLMLHVIVMMLLTLWEVTTSIAGIIRPGSGTKVILHAAANSGDLVTQIRGSAAEFNIQASSVSEERRQTAALPQTIERIEAFAQSAGPIEVASERMMMVQEQRDSALDHRSKVSTNELDVESAFAKVAVNSPMETQQVSQSEAAAQIGHITAMESVQRRATGEAIPTASVDIAQESVVSGARIEVAAQPREAAVDVALDAPAPKSDAAIARVPTNVEVEAMRIDAGELAVPRDAAAAHGELEVMVTASGEPISTSRVKTSGSTLVKETDSVEFASAGAAIDVQSERQEMDVSDTVDASLPRSPAPPQFSSDVDPLASGDQPTIDVAMEVAPMEGAPSSADSMDSAEAAFKPSSSPASERIVGDIAGVVPGQTEPTVMQPTRIEVDAAPSNFGDVQVEDAAVGNESIDVDAARVTELAAITEMPVVLNLGLPSEVAPPVDPYVQRSEDVRQELVDRLGGSTETEKAVSLALQWLARHQSEDGRWASEDFDDDCGQCGGKGRFETDIATTGLALLCFLGADHTHVKDGPYKDRVGKAVDWLLAQMKDTGDLRGNETMYSHGIATIAISEAWGMTRDARLEEPVRKAIGFIVGARNRSTVAGGWRYEPGQMGDTSVLGWQVMAMVSGKRAGIAVEDEALSAAGKWIEHVSLEQRPGRYAYQPGQRFTPSMTAEGMFVLQLLGADRDEPRMNGSVEYVLEHPPHWDEQPNTYYWYYATLALFQHQGEAWEKWNETLTRVLLANQETTGSAAGSWDPHDNWSRIGGRVYQTALCTLCLEVYYRYLPMYGATPAKAAMR